MFSETFKDKDGNEKTVVAKTQKELDKALADTKEIEPVTFPNINVPVEKGHDLVDVDEALNVELVDGTGSHNSPRDAVKDGGDLEGDPKVASPGAGEPSRVEQGTGKLVGDVTVKEPKEDKKSGKSYSK